MKVFIIDPGGVDKSTTGKILAKTINHDFIDLDKEFCTRIQNVRAFIKDSGYSQYCQQNSDLFYRILNEVSNDFVFTLSSGFLAYEGFNKLTKKHKQTIESTGVSIRLLPSNSLEKGKKIYCVTAYDGFEKYDINEFQR
jgi:shikimate kinase